MEASAPSEYDREAEAICLGNHGRGELFGQNSILLNLLLGRWLVASKRRASLYAHRTRPVQIMVGGAASAADQDTSSRKSS
jgi:hypothetical protein